jgi:hypothetical protein
MLLKISTATTVTIGPVLDADGAAVTTAVVTNFSIVKNGSSAALTTETLTHLANGYYTLALTSGNTNTLGNLEVFVNNTAMSMTVFRYNVIAAQVYDSIVSGTDLLQTDVREMLADVITSTVLATSAVDEIVDGVWDEVLTGATHNIASSAGRRLRQLASVIVRAGTAQGPGTANNQIQLDSGASSTNGDYDPGLIFIETGTGAGQARLILQYNGSTKVATVDRDWRVNPDNTSEFVILADAGRESVNEGLAQAGTTTSITLNANASSNDDAYNGQLVFIRSGTGQDQVALVEDYVGSTKVATIRTRATNGQWSVVPDTTSAYVMIPNLTFTVSEIQAGLATSSGVTSAFTEIKGAGWSSGTDTLEEIADAVAAISTGNGTGARTVTVTVNDGTTALQNAKVRMTSGAETYTALTNVSGVCTFNLNDATWVVSITRNGYSFSGTTLVVDGTETVTYSMSLVTITPSSSDKVTGYWTVLNENGVEAASVVVTIKARQPLRGGAGVFHDAGERTATSNVNGLVQFTNLIPGWRYAVVANDDYVADFVVPADAVTSVELGSIVARLP